MTLLAHAQSKDMDRDSRSIAIRKPVATQRWSPWRHGHVRLPICAAGDRRVDIVVAGDNAIVIALAAMALPSHLQKRAIVWGAVGAIAVRRLMTVVVVWLLKVPGVLLAGGLMLVWLPYQLLMPNEGEGQQHGAVPTRIWGAMRTIVIADGVMGLDNVLAVAGAAHGSYLLVVTVLMVSVPIVVWGSTLVLKVVDRVPGVVYMGAGVLVWTAAKMITGEPLVKPYVAGWPILLLLAYGAIPGVLWAGFAKNHRRLESRIHARLEEFSRQRLAGASNAAAAIQDSVSSFAPTTTHGTANGPTCPWRVPRIC